MSGNSKNINYPSSSSLTGKSYMFMVNPANRTPAAISSVFVGTGYKPASAKSEYVRIQHK